MLEQFEQIGKDALADLKKVSDPGALEEFRIKYLSRKGQVTQMLSRIGQFPPDQKRQAGQLANKVKKDVTEAFEQTKNSLSKTATGKPQQLIDVTIPGESIVSAAWVLRLLMALKSRTNGIILWH